MFWKSFKAGNTGNTEYPLHRILIECTTEFEKLLKYSKNEKKNKDQDRKHKFLYGNYIKSYQNFQDKNQAKKKKRRIKTSRLITNISA